MYKLMKSFLLLFPFLLCTVLMISSDAYADENHILRYLTVDDDGEMIWVSEEYQMEDSMTEEESAYVLFKDLLLKGSCIPDGAVVEGVVIQNGLLRLNFSEQMKNGGGTAAERFLILQIMNTASSLPGVDRLTILIGNRLQPLAEGSIIADEPLVLTEEAD